MDLTTEMEIVTATPDFNFKTISLANPHPLNGQAGFYFTQLNVGDDKSLCLQLPECLTKQGIVTIKNGKYLDLMFERSNHDELMLWLEQLEYRCQDIIDSKKELWFQTELSRDDIESMMTQVTRLYQSGKYMLMRVFVETVKTSTKCIAYDENEIGFDLDILEPSRPIIPLIMIEGVKFSSRSFEISLKLVQVMVIGKNEKKSSCLIKRQKDIHLEKTITEPALVKVPVQVQAPEVQIQAPEVHVQAQPVQAPEVQVQIKAPALVPIEAKETFIPIIKDKNALEEVTIDYNEVTNDSIVLKNPNDVYYELYKKAREKAKLCRNAAIEAYLEELNMNS
jgi:hypothetical protein